MADLITILLADDHPIFRGGLREVLGGDPSLTVVADVGEGAAALAAIERLSPDIAILDIDMPGANGLDVARAVRNAGGATRIVLLTMHDGADLLTRALDLGVAGYVLKDGAAAEILACVHMVASGQVYITPSMAGHLVKRRADARAAGNPFSALSPAELRVVALVADGRSTKEIATALSLSAKTVEHHRTHACEKLGLRGPNALIRYVMEHRVHLQ
jgi:DNA-binding NarL/FixJ family response regulator